jgi:hypothetical protein
MESSFIEVGSDVAARKSGGRNADVSFPSRHKQAMSTTLHYKEHCANMEE